MSHSAPPSRLRRALLLGTAAALLAPAAASAAPGDLTALADNAAAVKVSGDGAWAAYSAIGGNGKRQIFVRNLATAAVTPVTNGNLDSDLVRAERPGLDISVDGRYVVFDSAATDLVAGLVDGNGVDDVFRWDRVTGTTQLVSAGPDGGTVAGASRQPHVSGDGRWVVVPVGRQAHADRPGQPARRRCTSATRTPRPPRWPPSRRPSGRQSPSPSARRSPTVAS